MTKEKVQKILHVLGAVIAFCLLCLLLMGVFQYIEMIGNRVKVTVTAADVSILQGDETPVMLKAKVTAEDVQSVILDPDGKYTVDDLLQDLKQGKGYRLTTDARIDQEGDYNIDVLLNEDIKKKLKGSWKKKVKLTVEGGSFKVKNPIGEWNENRFKRYDGTYVTGEFVVSKGKTYYFDLDGQMTVGEVQIGLAKCTFDKDGNLVSKTENKINPDKPMVALTFDDGPGARTGEVLDQLEKYNAHATFFMLGRRVPGNADLVEKMKKIGSELGNHSYDHPKLTKSDEAEIVEQIGSTNNLIQEAAGQPATVMRPPYGAINDTLRANVGMPMILWNIDTLDWKTRDAQATIDTVMGQVKDGDIILMHDIHTESVDAALALIPKLQEAGFQLVTVSEMAGAKGISLESGEKYTDF